MQAPVELIKEVFIFLVLFAAVFQDLKWKKVFNIFSATVAIVSILILFKFEDKEGVLTGLISFGVLFGFLFLMFFFKVIGGGDVKLLLAVSFLFSWSGAMAVLLSAIAWGALLGVFQVILSGELKQFSANITQLFLLRKPIHKSNLHKIPFTVAILFGYLTYLILSKTGGQLL